MAYEVRWQVNFVAKNGDKFRIEILEDGWYEEPVRLLGAESPIETREDNPTDLFTPVRKQTGFLRIVDTGKDLDGNDFDYEDMMPSGTFDFQVRLWHEGENNTDTLRWIGYIRPDTLTSQMFEYVSIREFQLSCPLSTMYDVQFSFSNNQSNKGTIKSMGQILHAALSATGIEWEFVYKQNNISYRDDLNAVVSLVNFIGSTTPYNTTPPSSSDINTFSATWKEEGTYWGETVESICKFWGWVLYSRGTDIYITTPQDVKLFAKLQFSDLLSNSQTTPSDITRPTANLIDSDFVSTNHSSQRLNGHKMVKVVSDVNEQKDIATPDFSKATLEYYPSGQILHDNTGEETGSFMYVFKRFVGNTLSSETNRRYQYIDNLQVWQSGIIQTSGPVSPYIIGLIDYFQSDSFPFKTDFNFKSEIVIVQGGQTDSPIFSLQTINDIIIPQFSAICITCHAEKDMNNGSTNVPSPLPSGAAAEGHAIKATLQVGNKYWNGSSWQNSPDSFYLVVRSDGSITAPQNDAGGGFNPSGILFDNHVGSSGHVIYSAYEGLSGRLKLTLYKSNTGSPTSYSVNCILTGLSIFVVNEDDKMNPVNKSEQTYTDTANDSFLTDYAVNNNIASGGHNKYGFGQLYDPYTFQFLEYVDVRLNSEEEDQFLPEVNLLNRLKRMYSTVTKINAIEVKDNITASLPITDINIHGAHYSTVSCSHDWREGKMELTITDKL